MRPSGGARAPWFAWSYFAPQRAPRLSQNQESATTFRSLKPLCQRHCGPAGVRRSDTICVYCNTACAGDCWGKQQDKEIGRLKRKLVEVEAREERLLKQANTREEGHIVSLVNCYTELDTALLFLPAPGVLAAASRAKELLHMGFGLPEHDEGVNAEEHWCITGVGPRVWMEGVEVNEKTGLRYKVVGVQNEGKDDGMLVENPLS